MPSAGHVPRATVLPPAAPRGRTRVRSWRLSRSASCRRPCALLREIDLRNLDLRLLEEAQQLVPEELPARLENLGDVLDGLAVREHQVVGCHVCLSEELCDDRPLVPVAEHARDR